VSALTQVRTNVLRSLAIQNGNGAEAMPAAVPDVAGRWPRSTVRSTLNRLVSDGLATKTVVGRSTYYVITPAGRAALHPESPQ
jgi:DNA-binding PadR family transcriptional regulator